MRNSDTAERARRTKTIDMAMVLRTEHGDSAHDVALRLSPTEWCALSRRSGHGATASATARATVLSLVASLAAAEPSDPFAGCAA